MSELFLTREVSEDMILGASVYSTGGGLEGSNQSNLYSSLLEAKKQLRLVQIDNLRDSDFVCTVYSVGSAADTSYDLTTALKKGFAVMESFTGKKFKAIFPVETNIEALAFQAASSVGLPVLDADCTGGRAVPEIQFDNFFVVEKSFLPLVAVTFEGEVAILAESQDAKSIERFVRQLAIDSKRGVVAVIDHPISVHEARQALSLGTISRSLNLGRAIREATSHVDKLATLRNILGGQTLIEGRVRSIEFDTATTSGFLKGYYNVEDHSGNSLKVYVKNENLLCWYNNELLLTAPDFIITVDRQLVAGVHNSLIKLDQEVIVFGMPASELWRTKRGIELFSPATLGFSVSSKLLD